MKANEFMRAYGLDMAKKAIQCANGYGIDLQELKRLVESHELLSKATPEELYQAEICEGIWCNHKLKQAIADVESCQ